jgi:hypothetical protein
LIESPSDDEEEDNDNEREYDEDEVSLFIKKFNKFIKKRRPYKEERKEKPRSKRGATIAARMGISLPNAHMRGRKKTMTREYDEDEVTLFIKKFNKFIEKRIPYNGERKEKPRSKRVCYNYGKNVHFIAQCPYERKE